LRRHLSSPPPAGAVRSRLRRTALHDALAAAGLPDNPLTRTLAAALLAPLAERFVRALAQFDRDVGDSGFPNAAWNLFRRWNVGLAIHGAAALPNSGPLLLLANHPGLTDTLALMAAAGRRDLAFIARRNRFLDAMPHVSRGLILLDPDEHTPRSALGAASRHLDRGGALVVFPAGRIEPDPALRPHGARGELDRWRRPLATLFHRLPPATVALASVRGVANPKAYRHPLTRLRRGTEEREWSGAMLQVLMPGWLGTEVEVNAERLTSAGDETPEAGEIIEAMKRLLGAGADAGQADGTEASTSR
jgi:hypothetical protein